MAMAIDRRPLFQVTRLKGSLMRIILERHAYAPELNKAHIMRKGHKVASFAAPHCQSIKEARALCFPQYVARRIVTAEYIRDGEFSCFNRTRRAAYPLQAGNMAIIADHARRLIDMGGPLIDGRVIPPARLRLSTRLAYVKGA